MSEDEADRQPDSDHALDWTSEQLLTLIDNIGKTASLGRQHRTLSSRCTAGAKKVDWEAVKFDRFTADDCKQQFEHLLNKVGRIRTVKELLDCATAWLKKPVQQRGHADLPKKPLSAYIVFQQKVMKKLKKKHPEAKVGDIFRMVKQLYDELPDSKKAKQKERYYQERAEYEERLKEFYDAHPDLKPVSKPRRPMTLFVEEQVRKKLEQMDDPEQQTDKAHIDELRKKYSARWNKLSDKKKTKWVVMSASQHDDYVRKAGNSKTSMSRLLSSSEMRLLAAHQGRPLRPPSDIVRYFMSACPNAVSAASGGEAAAEEEQLHQQEQHEPNFRKYATRWKALPLLEQIEHWRAYYQAVTAYEAEIQEWQSQQDDATRAASVAEEKDFAAETNKLFDREEEKGKKYGYTIRGPAGLVAFEERRRDHLVAKHPDEAADPSGLRKVALAAFLKLSEDKRKVFEEKEKERLEGVLSSAVVKPRKRKSAANAKEGATIAAKRLKSTAQLEVDGVPLPPEPQKPPRSAYMAYIAHISALPADDVKGRNADGAPSLEPAGRRKNKLSNAAQSWRLLDKQEREVWEERCRAEKQQYETRLEAYVQSLSPEQREVYEAHRREQADLHRMQLNEAKKAREAVRQQYVQRTVVYHPPGAHKGGKSGKLVQSTIDAILKTGLAKAAAETGGGVIDHGNSETEDEHRDSVTDIDDDGGNGSDNEKTTANGVASARSPQKAAAVAATKPAAHTAEDTETEEDSSKDDQQPAARQSPRKTNSQRIGDGATGDGHMKTAADRKANHSKSKVAASASSNGGGNSVQPSASQSLQGTSSASSLGSQKIIDGHITSGKPRKAAAKGKAP